jgi:hypothetical protein
MKNRPSEAGQRAENASPFSWAPLAGNTKWQVLKGIKHEGNKKNQENAK